MRRFKQHVSGGFGNFRRGPAHDASQGLDSVVIGNHQVLLVQGALHVIQGGQLLPRLRSANMQRARDLVCIESMHWGAEQEHQVVGHVGGRIHRTRTTQHQFALQPQRRFRVRIDPRDLAHAEDGALGFRVHVDVLNRGVGGRKASEEVVIKGSGGRVGCRVAELEVEARRQLSRQSSCRQCVSPVWGDVHVEDGVIQTQELPRIRSGGQTLGFELHIRDGHDAGVLCLGQPNLHGRANHALGDLAVGLARTDGKATR